MNNDQYTTNEYLAYPFGSTTWVGEIHDSSWDVHWLHQQWANTLRVRNNGLSILVFSWSSLTDHVDRDTDLQEHNERINPLNL